MPVLEFKGKSVITTYHLTVSHRRIDFDPTASVLPKGAVPSLDGSLLVEGDNLLALKALLPTHAGQIKCVYIDPPYRFQILDEGDYADEQWRDRLRQMLEAPFAGDTAR